MVLKPDVLAAAIDAAPQAGPRLLMSPRGEPLTQALVRELAAGPGLLIVCGRFEGVDERVIEGAGPARGLGRATTCCRAASPRPWCCSMPWCGCCPASWARPRAATEESFEDGLLEHPHYTKPNLWEGVEIPEILLSGDHKAIAALEAPEQRESSDQGQAARPVAGPRVGKDLIFNR